MKQAVYIIGIVLVLLIGSSWVSKTLASRNGGSEIVSKTGIHWHSQLSIYIKGEQKHIPANVGIPPGAIGHPANLHTHDADNVIHMEFPGIVRSSKLEIGDFFKIWGKQFSSTCILEYCNGPEGTVVMKVNGATTTEFEKYRMKDGESIEIRFE